MDGSIPGLDEIFIGGQWRKPLSDRRWDVIDPSTEEKLTTVALPSEADADQAVAEARQAFDRGPWPRMSVQERISIVRRWTEAEPTMWCGPGPSRPGSPCPAVRSSIRQCPG
jgi:aldehyde dehydrogenase (NAD+)